MNHNTCGICEHACSSHEYREPDTDGWRVPGPCCEPECQCLRADDFPADMAYLKRMADTILTHPALHDRINADIAAAADVVDDLKVADE